MISEEELKELEIMVDAGLELYPDDPGFCLTKELIKSFKDLQEEYDQFQYDMMDLSRGL